MKNKKNNDRKTLSHKFVISFFVPFLIGTIISIIYVVFIFSVSPSSINSKRDLIKILREKEYKKTLPLILSGMYCINNLFQLYINNIAKIASFYKYNSKKLVDSVEDVEAKLRLINKFSYNGINDEQINKFNNLYKKYNYNNEYLYNQAKWFIDLNKIELNQNNDINLINQIYSLINLIPILKTIIKTTNVYYETAEIANQVFIMFSESELFFKYPIVYEYLNGKDLRALYQTTNCKTTKNEQYPQYYYFKCRPYYSFLLRAVNKGYNVSISDIYKFVEGNYGITVCFQFPDVVSENKELVSICHDMELETVIKQLNSINNKIPGYIFLMKVGSEIPLYYPEQFKKNLINLANMEFSLKSQYYSDEVSLFIKNISTIVAEYKYNKSNTEIISFDISKNDELYNYSLYPIYFDLPDISEPIHMLTLVYVNPHNKDYQIEYLYSTICISGIYLLMGCFLLLLSKYLITSIAKNIVRPIKTIKDLLEQDMDDNTIDYQDEKEIYNKDNDINFKNDNRKLAKKTYTNVIGEENDIDGNIINKKDTFVRKESFLMPGISAASTFISQPTMVGSEKEGGKKYPNFLENKNSNLNLKLIEEENNSSDDEFNSSFDNEEEIDKSKYRSDNIQQLFIKLVDLKNAFKCLKNTKPSNDKLLNLVYAQNVFNDINNLEASSLCQSNISSLFVKVEEFDKAISHLYNGIEDINKKIFPKNHNNKNKEIKINIDKLKKKIKNENLINRYIKLFYCYRQYFKMLKRKYKNNSSIDINLDSFYITHHIKTYKKCLDDYIYRVKEYIGGKDLCIGLLAKLEEKISFELPSFKDANKENDFYKNIRNNISKNEKEKIVNEIIELFKEVDKLNNSKVSINNYNIVHLINVLKYDSDIVNAMDVPPSILIQKTNYLKGKFHLKCYDYKTAITHFENALDYGKIGDIEITINTYKYLIKISKIYLDLVNNDIEFHSQEYKNKIELKEDKQRKEILEKYIKDLTTQMNNFRYIPKDIFIILNFGNISKSNNLNINEKFINIQKILVNIYENITTNKDRMGIIEYKNNDYRFLITLKNKDEKNDKKFKEIFDNLEFFLLSSCDSDNNNIDTSSNNNYSILNRINGEEKNLLSIKNIEKEKSKENKGMNSSCLFNSIKYGNGYLKRKQLNYLDNNSIVDNWFIFISCAMTDDEINEIIQKPINENLFPDEESNNNLIIIFYENISEEGKKKLIKWLKFNKSTVLMKDELINLKDIMGTKGEKQKIIFDLEKYKDKLQ